MFYLQLPFIFLTFWYLQAPVGLLAYFASLNRAFLKLSSLLLLLKTFFRPWKNEYRKGLVGFSIGMGMFIKSFVIATDTLLLLGLVASEIVFFVGFLLLPIVAIALLFI